MLGFVEHRSAAVWCEVSAEANSVELEYWQEDVPANRNRVKYTADLGNVYNPVRFVLANLALNTQYIYAIYVNGQQQLFPYLTKFRTKDLWEHRRAAPDFSFLFGSCLYINEPEFDRPGKPYGKDLAILKTMTNQAADFNLWLGDNTYLREVDYSSVSGMAYRYSHDRAVRELQPLLCKRPNYAIWDDHDYGFNDADGSFRFKDDSRKLFQSYWGNPSCGQEGKGIYTSFTYSDAEFFLLDDRFFRSSDKMKDTDPHKTYWGKEQLAWLENALLTSTATFKFIVNGNEVLNPVEGGETVHDYPNDYNQLINFIGDNHVQGIIFLSGDRHFSEVIGIQPPRGYKLYDLCSSPLTATPYTNLTAQESANPHRVQGALYNTGQNFGRVSISGAKGSRKMMFETLDIDGKKQYDFIISEKDLQ